MRVFADSGSRHLQAPIILTLKYPATLPKKIRYSMTNKTPQIAAGENNICEPQPLGLAGSEVLDLSGIKLRKCAALVTAVRIMGVWR